MTEAIQAVIDKALKEEAAERKRQDESVKLTNELRARMKKEYDESEQGACRRQIEQADREMRATNPTPGNKPGNPLKGPSS